MSDIRTQRPTEESTTVELLECIDDALRNGRLMTRANLAFDYLLQRLDLKRTDLPSYVADIAALRAEDEAYLEALKHLQPSAGQVWVNNENGELIVTLIGRKAKVWIGLTLSEHAAVEIPVETLTQEWNFATCGDHDEWCCKIHHTHSSPHKGCILR